MPWLFFLSGPTAPGGRSASTKISHHPWMMFFILSFHRLQQGPPRTVPRRSLLFGRDGSGGAAAWHGPSVPPDRGKEGDITGTGDPGPASSQASRPSRDTEYRCPLSRPSRSQARREPIGPRSRRPQKSGRRHVRFCCFHSGIPEPMLLHRSLWHRFRAVPKRGWSS